MNLRRYITSVISLLILLSFVLGVNAQSNSETNVLSLVFAIDNSGSMSNAVRGNNNNDIRAIDRSHAELFYDDVVPISSGTPATDPLELRYTVIEDLIGWLATYSTQNDNLDIEVTVLGYEDTVTELLSTVTLSSAQEEGVELDRPSALPDIGRHANYTDLYTELDEITSASSSRGNQAVFIVTDSTPCIVNEASDFCYVGDGATQLQTAETLADSISEYLYFITPGEVSISDFWDSYDTTLNTWNNRLESDTFYQLESMDEAVSQLIADVMQNLARVQGIVDQDTSVSSDLTPADYIEMGIIYTNNDTFSIPPYQISANALFRTQEPDATMELNAPSSGNQPELIGDTDGVLQRYSITNPVVGEWGYESLQSSIEEAWVLIQAGTAQVRIEPQNPSQYETLQVVYEVLDADGRPMDVRNETQPDFSDLSLTLPPLEGESVNQEIALNMQINDEQNGFISQQILTLDATSNRGDYDISGIVEPGTNTLWSDDTTYNFLQANYPPITVSPLTFDFDFIIDELGSVAESSIEFPRSLGLTVEGTVDREAIPEGIVLSIDISDLENESTCPITRNDVLPVNDDRTLASTYLDFPEDGSCVIALSANITSSLPPLNGSSQPVTLSQEDRTVIVSDIQTLYTVLVDEDGNLLNTENGLSMEDRNVDYNLNTKVIFIEFREDASAAADIVAPVFRSCLDGGEDSDDGIPSDSEVTCSADSIPFELSILNNLGENIADDNDINIETTDTPGRYRVRITGLSPAIPQLWESNRYDIQVTTLTGDSAPELDYLTFEYAGNPANTPIDVQFNQTLFYIGITIVVGVLVLLMIIVYLNRKYRNPIRGAIGIYKATPDNELVELLKHDWGRGNVQKLPRTKFTRPADLALLNIRGLDATTKDNKNVSKQYEVFVTLNMNEGNPPRDEKMMPYVPYPIRELEGSTYYLVQLEDRSLTMNDLSNN